MLQHTPTKCQRDGTGFPDNQQTTMLTYMSSAICYFNFNKGTYPPQLRCHAKTTTGDHNAAQAPLPVAIALSDPRVPTCLSWHYSSYQTFLTYISKGEEKHRFRSQSSFRVLPLQPFRHALCADVDIMQLPLVVLVS